MSGDVDNYKTSLTSRVFGSHTITLGAVVQSSERICVPRSRDIKIWSTTETEDTTFPTPHRSIITYICQSPPDKQGTVLCASCDWNGLVVVYDSRWNPKYSFPTPNPPAAGLKFLTSDRLVVLSRGRENFNPGCVVVYQIGEEGVVAQSRELYDKVWQIECFQGEVYVWKWVEPVFTLTKYNEKLEVVKEFELMVEKAATIGHAVSDKHIVLSFQSRDLVVLDSKTMIQRDSSKLRAVSKSPIWAVLFVSEDEVLLQASRENFIVVNLLTGNIVKSFQGPSSFVCFMEIADHSLWIGTVDGVFRVHFASDEIFQERPPTSERLELQTELTSFLFHEIACCGLCVDNNLVISGDLGGNILIWDTCTSGDIPTFRTKIEDSVRCLHSVRRGDVVVVFIGTLSGCLLQWKLGSEPSVVTHKEDTISCIRTAGERLCFGLVTGHVEVFEMSSDDVNELILTRLFSIKVHHPVESETDLRFGSLNIKAEVWSLEFSPCSNEIATCSEDQTVKITSLETQQTISTFKDHRLAVTCLSWIISSGLSLLISCSDDNTVVIRETVTSVKLKTLPLPSEVIGFCTLTYLGVLTPNIVPSVPSSSEITEANVREIFEQCINKITVVCGSENGYLILRDMVSGSVLYNERVHQGSIEGLACQAGRVVTCSSDCCVQVHSIVEGM
ncbi:hypothetical protein ACHWQZ_G009225 [Mnemiopsis leidyi]